jgi:hypothetical protein
MNLVKSITEKEPPLIFLILQTIPLFGGLPVGTTESINELMGYKMFHGYAIYL